MRELESKLNIKKLLVGGGGCRAMELSPSVAWRLPPYREIVG